MHYEVYTRDFGTQTGTYICTLDNYHQDVDAIDYSTSEHPAEHKSHNLIELIMGSLRYIQIIECVSMIIALLPKFLKILTLRYQQFTIKSKMVMTVMDWVLKRIISGKQQKKEVKPDLFGDLKEDPKLDRSVY